MAEKRDKQAQQYLIVASDGPFSMVCSACGVSFRSDERIINFQLHVKAAHPTDNVAIKKAPGRGK